MGQTRVRRTQVRWAGILAAAALVTAGCGDDALGQLTDAFGGDEEGEDGVEVVGSTADDPDDSDDSDAGGDVAVEAPAEATSDDTTGSTSDADPVAVPIEAQPMDAIVRNGGIQYTLSGLEVVDLDAGADQRTQGVELRFDVSAYNPWGNSRQPRSNVSLQWNEDGGENVETVNGRGEFREIPPQASSSGEIVVPLSPADLDRFHQPSARLIIGTAGSSAAEVPLGPEAELIDRLPVNIPLDLVMDMGSEEGGFEATFHRAIIVYERDGGSQGVPDGEAILEFEFDLDNQGAGQSCSTRGTGAFGLTVPNGDGIVEIGVSERCISGEQAERGVFTGFVIDADYAGDYVLTHQRSRAAETLEGQIAFTLEETPGAPIER